MSDGKLSTPISEALARRPVNRTVPPFLPDREPPSADLLEPEPGVFKPFYAIGKAVFDGGGDAVAAARSPEEGRRIAAALNTAYGISTEALEAWSVGSVQDPVNDMLAELESVLAPPASEDRRGRDRRQSDRRRAIHEIRIEEK